MTSLRPITPEQHGEAFVAAVESLLRALGPFLHEFDGREASGNISYRMQVLRGPVGHAFVRVSQHLDARKGR